MKKVVVSVKLLLYFAALCVDCSLTRQRSKRVSGEPFLVKEVVAVDMFPHTEHYELVLLLERTGSNNSASDDPK